jgi:hypothetical protein
MENGDKKTEGLEAFLEMREIIARSGQPEMTLDEINRFIKEVRAEIRERKEAEGEQENP